MNRGIGVGLGYFLVSAGVSLTGWFITDDIVLFWYGVGMIAALIPALAGYAIGRADGFEVGQSFEKLRIVEEFRARMAQRQVTQ